jgi:Na+-driven multidrug efflux pump
VGDRNFGLVAGLISGLIISLLSIAYQVVAPPPLELLTGPDGSSIDLAAGFISNTLLSLMLGAAGGWAGGWLATREQAPLP